MSTKSAHRENKPLTRRWIIRASADDDAAARANAQHAGVRFSEYIRRMGVGGKIIVRQDTIIAPDLASLTTAINRAGNLVNQQMAIAHHRGVLPDELLRLNLTLETAIDAVLSLRKR